ncbi:MAG: DUF1232 domain-containing protein [Oscillospiraceae bacterium]|nr:DUF1232 domain-containing protein [Oscillospiraceae bacterium]
MSTSIALGLKKYTKGTVETVGRGLELLAASSDKLEPFTELPFIGDTVCDIRDTVCMLNDYFSGRYRNMPKSVLIGCGVAVLYVALPYDLIPDNIPFFGFVDDAFVVKFIMSTCISRELDTYRRWRAEQAE